MEHKIYELLGKWENEWQDLQDRIALESCESDSDLYVEFLKLEAKALYNRMEELRKIVSE
jgi:hypothetical protein